MLSETIRKLRKEKGYSQEQMARKLNVSQGAISQWETGLALPSANQLVQIADLFGVSVDFLLERKKEELLNEIDPLRSIKGVKGELNERGLRMLSNYHKLTPENQIRASAYLEGLLSSQGN